VRTARGHRAQGTGHTQFGFWIRAKNAKQERVCMRSFDPRLAGAGAGTGTGTGTVSRDADAATMN